MDIEVIDNPVPLEALARMAASGFGDLVKAVVDIERGLMAVNGELHADEEAVLLQRGSAEGHLWGINIYPLLPTDERIEFDSLINIRPAQGNRSRGVEDPGVREAIRRIVASLLLP